MTKFYSSSFSEYRTTSNFIYILFIFFTVRTVYLELMKLITGCRSTKSLRNSWSRSILWSNSTKKRRLFKISWILRNDTDCPNDYSIHLFLQLKQSITSFTFIFVCISSFIIFYFHQGPQYSSFFNLPSINKPKSDTNYDIWLKGLNIIHKHLSDLLFIWYRRARIYLFIADHALPSPERQEQQIFLAIFWPNGMKLRVYQMYERNWSTTNIMQTTSYLIASAKINVPAIESRKIVVVIILSGFFIAFAWLFGPDKKQVLLWNGIH